MSRLDGITLTPEATIESIRDGRLYILPPGIAITETTFTQLYMLEFIVGKLPAQAAKEDFNRYVVNEEPMLDKIRRLEKSERGKNLESTLRTFKDFAAFRAMSTGLAHYAVVHKLQYERLQALNVRVPQTRFVAAIRRRDDSPVVGIFQEIVRGTTLLEMFDLEQNYVKPEYHELIPVISGQLSQWLQSRARNHINWYIRNFVFHGPTQTLFYVDCKPSVMFSKKGNDWNIGGLKKYFKVRDSGIRRFVNAFK